MVIQLKQASGGTSAVAGSSSRAESNQASMNDTKMKRKPGIDELEGDDHGEDKQGGREEYNRGGVLDEYEEKHVLHAGRVSHVQAMKRNTRRQ